MTAYKVLVPLDGSRLAETSLAYLVYLKQFGDLHVRLVSVDEEARPTTAGLPKGILTPVLQSYLQHLADHIRSRLGVPVDFQVSSGHPSSRILEAASALCPDLVLIATHGRSGINRLRNGSVADKVIHAVQCPVLAIGPNVLGRLDWADDESSGPFQRILVPLDGSELAEGAIPLAQRFATAFGSCIHFVRVVPESALMDAALTNQFDKVDSLLFGARDYLAEVVDRPGLASAAKRVIAGQPIDVLRSYVEDQSIDLVIMTSLGCSGFSRTAFGSVADRMIGTSAPVLVVPALHESALHSGRPS